MEGYRFQELQFDRDLDPVWLRIRRQNQRVGGRAAHCLGELWEREIMKRIKLSEKPDWDPLFSHQDPAQTIRKLTLVARHTNYRVDVEVRVWDGTWETVLIGCLSYDQASPFLTRGKIRVENYGQILPVVIRHCRYSNGGLLELPELKCILAGQLPELTLI